MKQNSKLKKAKVEKVAKQIGLDNQYYLIGKCTSLKQKFGYNIQPPVMLLLGDQGAGKSHVNNRLACLTVSPQRQAEDNGKTGAKTICPVSNTYIYTDSKDFKVEISDEKFEKEEICFKRSSFSSSNCLQSFVRSFI